MVIPSAKTRPATYEDILRLPENVVGEIVDGELVVSPRPALRHALATSYLGGELTGRFGRGRGVPGGWVILFEPELHLGDHILVPDLAGWLRERMPTVPDAAWFSLRPDWVCEVLSPATALLDRTRKQDIYRQQGVPWIWFVDPAAHTIEVLRMVDDRLVVMGTFGGDGRASVPPFDAAEIDVGALWDSPIPAPSSSQDPK